MKNGLSTSLKAGNGTAEGIAILALLLIVILVMPKGAPNPTAKSANAPKSAGSSEKNATAPDSPYARNISLSTGNASYAYQPYEEYITIYNAGRESVDITGWQLKNGKDKRAYDLGGTIKYFSADTAIIPQAALFISPKGLNKLQDVILTSGETAIITTGQVGSQSPYKTISFKENICSGYLENMPEYTFTPSLSMSCPRPDDEPGVNALDTECRRFIERMGSCRIPEFNTRDRDGDICSNCVDGKPLSSSCVTFIKNHFNYDSCIANHASDPNFSGRTWRIFLGQDWEMWAKDYETIKLFDRLGQLVGSRTY